MRHPSIDVFVIRSSRELLTNYSPPLWQTKRRGSYPQLIQNAHLSLGETHTPLSMCFFDMAKQCRCQDTDDTWNILMESPHRQCLKHV